MKLSDLRRASIVTFNAGRIGAVKAEPYDAEFEAFAGDGTWASAEDFVRDLLLKRCTRADSEDPVCEDDLADLSDDELHDTADAFLDTAGRWFQPRYVASGEGRRRRIRLRKESEAYDMAKAPGETGSARLLRILRDHVKDRQDSRQLMLQPSLATSMLMDDLTGSSIEAAMRQVGGMTDFPLGAMGALSRLDGRYDAAMGTSAAAGFGAQIASLNADPFGLAGLSRKDSVASTLAAYDSLARYPNIGGALDAVLGADRLASAAAGRLHTPLDDMSARSATSVAIRSTAGGLFGGNPAGFNDVQGAGHTIADVMKSTFAGSADVISEYLGVARSAHAAMVAATGGEAAGSKGADLFFSSSSAAADVAKAIAIGSPPVPPGILGLDRSAQSAIDAATGRSAMSALNIQSALGLDRIAAEKASSSFGGVGSSLSAIGLAAGDRNLGAIEGLRRTTEGILAHEARLASVINHEFGLGISGSYQTLLKTADRVRELASDRSIFPPGYQLAAFAGLHDVSLGGAAADILRRYGERPAAAPIFARAMAGATVFDDPASGAEATERLKELAAFIVEALPKQPDPIVRIGFFNLLMLVLTIIGTAAGVWSAIGAADAPTAADLKTNTEEIRGLRADLDARERKRAEEDRRIRHVNGPAPLRLKPNGKSPAIKRVYSDQMVRVIDERGSWLLVEVMDYQSDAVTCGWLNRNWVRLRPRR